MIKALFLVGLLGLLVFPNTLFGAAVSWVPEQPLFTDRVTVTVSGCPTGTLLHWTLNAKGSSWQKADDIYMTPDSVREGIAIRTPLKPDGQGGLTATLGPFNQTTQQIGTLDFALFLPDETWDSNGGKDYHIPLGQGRITVVPEHPTLNDVLTVTVHRAKPGGELRWGVNAEHHQWQPPHECYWPKGTVPSDDDLAVDSTILGPESGQDTAVIRLGPFNKVQQAVTSLHMAVHWDKEWDTDFGRNYNVPILLTDPSERDPVTFLTPGMDDTIVSNLVIQFQGATTNPVQVWLDGQPLLSFLRMGCSCQVDVTDLDLGPHRLTLMAPTTQGATMDSVRFWRVPRYETVERPEDLAMGATVTNGLLTLALLAPGKHCVSVVGDFNRWDPKAGVMNVTTDGVWLLTVPIEDGSWQYQYLVDGETLLADPCSTDVEWKDVDGKETWKPEMARSVIEVGQPPYTWHDDAWQTPALSNLVIYEFFIEDFCPGEGFTGVLARLDWIVDLGVNAIEPLPVTECPGEGSWGYNPSFFMAPESLYGTPNELKQLIDACHQRGLAFIGDMVFNHMDPHGSLFQLYGTDYEASPYFYLFTGENWGMPDLDQESPAFKEFIANVIRHWIRDYHFDGYRYDATRWVGWQGYNDWGASWFAWVGRDAASRSIQIAEHLPTDAKLMNQTEMDAGWHAHFRWRVRDMLIKADLDPREFFNIMTPSTTGFSNVYQRIAYTESHDEERMVRELEEAGFSEDEVRQRAEAALIITVTAPGIPMIYAGQEFGENTKKTVGPNPLHWDRVQPDAYGQLVDVTRRLCKLKRDNAALQSQGARILLNDGQRELCAYLREAANAPSVLTVCNLGHQPQTLALSVSNSWRNVLTDQVTTNLSPISVPAGQGLVFEQVIP